jgi:hypothetical protein
MRAALQVNWRNKASYGYAAKLTGLGWAWEFLRRNPRFREECAQSQARPTTGGKVPRAIFPPSKWGVLRADSLDQTATGANVFWDPAVCRHVLPVLSATPSIAAPPRHVLLCEGDRRLQLFVEYHPWLAEDVLLTSALTSPAAFRRHQHAIACLNAYVFTGHLPKRLFEHQPASSRLVDVAQALDGALCNASHREIAVAVYGERRAVAWHDPGDHLRDSIRRAINRGRHLMNGGYRRFLR